MSVALPASLSTSYSWPASLSTSYSTFLSEDLEDEKFYCKSVRKSNFKLSGHGRLASCDFPGSDMGVSCFSGPS